MAAPEQKPDVPRTTQIARALGLNENGLATVFLLNEESLVTQEHIAMRFANEQLPIENLPQTLVTLEEVGLISRYGDDTYALTEEGAAATEKILNFIATTKKNQGD